VKVARESLLAQTDVVGAPLRAALTGLYDGWLAELLGDPGPGVALVAVGALGRQDPTPGSDLDLVLVHEGARDLAALADRLWYPIWDSGVGLDHSVPRLPQGGPGPARRSLRRR
jgi:[protein-PII] uridylyltransferase